MSEFLQFLTAIGVAAVGVFGSIRVAKIGRKIAEVDERNTEQHGEAQQFRSEQAARFREALDRIEHGLGDTRQAVGRVEGVLEAHIHNSHAHEPEALEV